ncbi:SusC/RagA family TonB-linked outer membrane protein [Galbibacter mesophilus]|uniref:SusC/RagA family TonB-linked outer membrane protein n=1 Tax=Galbibacter mesophilus TaxID=379069 RepID=UPI00191FDB05|nr:TonB-dependent receptor [Galbibacter mesophilus]MCM5664042.1 TonB-dependent receptor [Galbibacter mesophilus]
MNIKYYKRLSPERSFYIVIGLLLLFGTKMIAKPISNSTISKKTNYSFSLVEFQTQELTITGTVKDENGVTIPGVNVYEDGNGGNGVMTDMNGNYSIKMKNREGELVFSFIGFAEVKASINGRTEINITLQEQTTDLEEVVVVGYGKQKKVTVTGAISSVSTEELTSSPSSSVANALAGKVTGLSSIQYSGQPGADNANLLIRGVGTLSQGNSSPLIMVDGVERDFTQIDPEEIDNITILKDASATAVYGIRGANGVILVTTKRGKIGEARISASFNYGIQEPVRLPDFADSYTYATAFNRAQISDGVPEDQVRFTPDVVEAFRTGSDPILFPDIDWMDYLIRSSAPQTRANFNVNGGTERIKYFLSFSHLNQEGMFKTFDTGTGENFNYERYNYRSNIDIDVTKSTQLSMTLGGRSEIRQEPNVRETQDQFFRFLYRATPFASPGIVDGRYIVDNGEYIPGPEIIDGLRPYYGRGGFVSTNTVYNFDASLTQKLDVITKGLEFSVKGSYNRNARQTKIRNASPDTYTAFYLKDFDDTLPEDDKTLVFPLVSKGGRLNYNETYGKNRSWYFEAAFNYNRRFGKHEFSGLLMYNQRSNYYPGGSFNYLPTGYVGTAARVTYNYDRRYLLEANFGYNGSENFAEENRYGLFPAFSFGWVISEEQFMKNNPVIDYFKLRGSYGKVGSDRQGNNRFLYLPDGYGRGDGYSFGIDVPSDQPGFVETKLGNPNVTWETAIKQNYGMDIRILNNQLEFNVDYFWDKRRDILTTRNTVPGYVAAVLPAVNIGAVDNSGYELNVTWTQNFTNFNYWINPNISYAKNEIVFMDEVKQEYDYQYRTGGRVGQPFGFVSQGFFSKDDFNADGTLKDGFPEYAGNVQPGDAMYEDINEDGVVNDLDQRAIGFPEYPEYTIGINAGFKYKNFDFRMSWAGAKNTSRMLEGELRVPFGSKDDFGLLSYFAEDTWTPETAETARFPRLTFSNKDNNFSKASTIYQLDASYLRLKTLEMGYNLKSKFIRKAGIKTLRFFFSGYNLLTFDKLDGMVDPESKIGNRPTHPAMKIYNFGVKFNF